MCVLLLLLLLLWQQVELRTYHALTQIAESSQICSIADYFQLQFRRLVGQQVTCQYARLLRVHQIQIIVRHLLFGRVIIKLIVRRHRRFQVLPARQRPNSQYTCVQTYTHSISTAIFRRTWRGLAKTNLCLPDDPLISFPFVPKLWRILSRQLFLSSLSPFHQVFPVQFHLPLSSQNSWHKWHHLHISHLSLHFSITNMTRSTSTIFFLLK